MADLTIQLTHDNRQNFQLELMSRTRIWGKCDSGKTEICKALLGLSKVMSVDSNEIDLSRIGFIPTNPYLTFTGIKGNLWGELEFSRQLIGEDYDGLESISSLLGITHLLRRDPFTLSGGEAVRASIAIILSGNPSVILLDQVYDSLFPADRISVQQGLLDHLEENNISLVETQSVWLPEIDAISHDYVIADKAIVKTTSTQSQFSPVYQKPEYFNDFENSLEVASLSFSYAKVKGSELLRDINIELTKGSISTIVGRNGIGKSTLLKSLALILRPSKGYVTVKGKLASSIPHLRPKEIFYCFQDPGLQIYRDTVEDEINDIVFQLSGEKINYNENYFFIKFGLDKYLGQDPITAPLPIKRLIVICAALIAGPPVILMDEPTSYLDKNQRENLAGALFKYKKTGGTCLIVSHDKEFVEGVSDYQWEMNEKGLSRVDGLAQ